MPNFATQKDNKSPDLDDEITLHGNTNCTVVLQESTSSHKSATIATKLKLMELFTQISTCAG